MEKLKIQANSKFKNLKVTLIIIGGIVLSILMAICILEVFLVEKQDKDVPITIGEIDYTYSIIPTGSWDQTYFLEIEIDNEILSYAYYGDVFGFDGYEVEVVEVYSNSEAKYYEIQFKVKTLDVDSNIIWSISRARHFIEEKNGEHIFIDKIGLESKYDFLIEILNDENHRITYQNDFTDFDEWTSPNYTDTE